MFDRLTTHLLDLVFPPFCQGCTREGSYLCLVCQNRINVPIHRCPVCNRNSPLGRVHEHCSSESTALSGLMVASEYRNPAVKNLIWHLKYNSVKAISETLATIMADFLVGSDLVDYFHDSLVIPVPMHEKRERFRGFNQAETLAKHLARNLHLEFSPALTKTKKTDRQVDLEKRERLENVKNVFSLTPHFNRQLLSGRSILLIDDVATTGATLNECAKVLNAHEPAEIWGLVVARN